VPDAGPALRSYRLVTELFGSLRQQRRQLADLGVTRLTVKSRDVDADPRVVLRGLAQSEGPQHVLVMTRLGTRAISLLVEPALPRSA
jgi:THUMP domain-like